jgi:hypothetical protein
MKLANIIVAAFFAIGAAVTSAAAFASAYAGKLDLGSAGADPSAIAFRELHDGMWLVGAQQQLWHLQNLETDREVFHISGYWCTRLEGQDTAYGPSIGVNFSEAANAALGKIEVIAPIVAAVPPWVTKITDWTSLEFYGGYRPVVGSDDHHWIYGVGGKVTIPLSALYAWARGTNGQKGL